MSAATSPLIDLPSQQHQTDPHHHHRSDDQQQPLSSANTTTSTTSKNPSTSSTSTSSTTAAIMRRNNKPATDPGVIRLEIYADLLCPWCFIEKRSLDALTRRYAEEHPDVRFEVVWKPYYIAPAMAKHNVDKRSIYSRLNTLNPTFLPRIHLAAAKHNISFSIRGLTGNTRPAHRLIASTLAKHGPEAQSRVVEALFRGHFEDGRDLSDEAWLAAVGAEAGGMAESLLLGDDEEEQGRRVDEVAERARREFGVEAVPCVMVQGRYKVGGYQEGVVFERLFDKIRLGGEVL
ncbi:thioredoxin-like protein [Trichoderma aethiopicum]